MICANEVGAIVREDIRQFASSPNKSFESVEKCLSS